MFRKRLGGRGDPLARPTRPRCARSTRRLLDRDEVGAPAARDRRRARHRDRPGGARPGEPARAHRRRGLLRRRRFTRSGSSSSLLACTFVLRGAFTVGHGGRGAPRPPGACCRSCGSRSWSGACARSRRPPTESRSAEIAAVAVQGIEGLESYFARYLPAGVLASIVPLLVIGWVAFVDIEAALIMLLTLPLVPVFMWLIGRHTEERTRERWQALRRLSDRVPRRRARPADAAGVQPRPRPGGDGRGRQRALPARRRWRRCGSASSRAACWSWRPRSGWRSSR